MAKKSSILTNNKRLELCKKYEDKRRIFKEKSLDTSLSYKERFHYQSALDSLPRNSSYTRYRNRCMITGRPRGYYRHFGVSRIVLREMALSGITPGVIKASW